MIIKIFVKIKMKIGLLFGQQIFANIQELKYKLTPDPVVDALGLCG